MTYKLMLACLLAVLVVMAVTKSFAGDGDDQGQDDDGQGGIVIVCPPGGCIQ